LIDFQIRTKANEIGKRLFAANFLGNHLVDKKEALWQEIKSHLTIGRTLTRNKANTGEFAN